MRVMSVEMLNILKVIREEAPNREVEQSIKTTLKKMVSATGEKVRPSQIEEQIEKWEL